MAFDGKSDHYCMNGFEAIDVIEAYGLNFALGKRYFTDRRTAQK